MAPPGRLVAGSGAADDDSKTRLEDVWKHADRPALTALRSVESTFDRLPMTRKCNLATHQERGQEGSWIRGRPGAAPLLIWGKGSTRSTAQDIPRFH